MATTPTRHKFTDTYWIISERAIKPYGRVSFTRLEYRKFHSQFRERLIWAGRKPVQEVAV